MSVLARISRGTDKPQGTYDEIRAGFDGALDQIEVMHNKILVGIYLGPGVTAGGVIMPDKLKDEDRWQGKVGAVLKKGVMAFSSDARNDFKGQNIEVGEWIVFRVTDGIPIDVCGVHCRLIEDIHVQMKTPAPEIIY